MVLRSTIPQTTIPLRVPESSLKQEERYGVGTALRTFICMPSWLKITHYTFGCMVDVELKPIGLYQCVWTIRVVITQHASILMSGMALKADCFDLRVDFLAIKVLCRADCLDYLYTQSHVQGKRTEVTLSPRLVWRWMCSLRGPKL